MLNLRLKHTRHLYSCSKYKEAFAVYRVVGCDLRNCWFDAVNVATQLAKLPEHILLVDGSTPRNRVKQVLGVASRVTTEEMLSNRPAITECTDTGADEVRAMDCFTALAGNQHWP